MAERIANEDPNIVLKHKTNAGSLLILCVTALTTLVVLLLPDEAGTRLTDEGGLFESLSLVVIAIGVMAAGLRLWHSPSLLWAGISVLFLWMFLRELDYQTYFTKRSIESTGFYLSPKQPLKVKVIAALALSPFALAGMYLFSVGVRAMMRSPFRQWGIPTVSACALLGAAFSSEKLRIPKYQMVEEVCEVGFVCLVTFLVIQRLRQAFSNRGPLPHSVTASRAED